MDVQKENQENFPENYNPEDSTAVDSTMFTCRRQVGLTRRGRIGGRQSQDQEEEQFGTEDLVSEETEKGIFATICSEF